MQGSVLASTSAPRGGGGRRDAVQDSKNAPWIEKFRPQTLDEVAAHTEIIDTSERGGGALWGSSAGLGLGPKFHLGAIESMYITEVSPGPRDCGAGSMRVLLLIKIGAMRAS